MQDINWRENEKNKEEKDKIVAENDILGYLREGQDLSMEEALTICKTMNDEAEELLFRVYNSNTNKLVK